MTIIQVKKKDHLNVLKLFTHANRELKDRFLNVLKLMCEFSLPVLFCSGQCMDIQQLRQPPPPPPPNLLVTRLLFERRKHRYPGNSLRVDLHVTIKHLAIRFTPKLTRVFIHYGAQQTILWNAKEAEIEKSLLEITKPFHRIVLVRLLPHHTLNPEWNWKLASSEESWGL